MLCNDLAISGLTFQENELYPKNHICRVDLVYCLYVLRKLFSVAKIKIFLWFQIALYIHYESDWPNRYCRQLNWKQSDLVFRVNIEQMSIVTE